MIKEQEYEEFPIVERRNYTQEIIEVPLLIKTMNIPTGKDMLEVGCGMGIALSPFQKHCNPTKLVGLDIDEKLVSLAQKRCQAKNLAATVLQGDIRSLPFPDASFDVVIDFGTCYHISKAGLALAEISRVLRPNGIFVFETKLNQFFSHPFRSYGRHIPWKASPKLHFEKSFLLWGSARKKEI